MFDITQEQLDKLRMQFPKGVKVRLVKMDDFQAPPIGTEGEVKKREWESRNEAIAFYVDCMLHSEGAEQERYLEIYIDLMAGKTLCLDEKSAKK